MEEAIKLFEGEFEKFLAHEFRIFHQKTALKIWYLIYRMKRLLFSWILAKTIHANTALKSSQFISALIDPNILRTICIFTAWLMFLNTFYIF